MSGPTFIRVTPDEVARYGAAGAIVIAHIRYRCESPGPGRIEADGWLWWRVSHHDLGLEVGMTARSVRTALRALGDAITAKPFAPLSNQSLAYRVATERTALTSQSTERSPSDQPVDRSVTPDDRSVEVPRPNGHLPATDRSSALPLETLEKGGEDRAASPSHAPPAPSALTANSNGESPPAAGGDPEPPRYCPRHPAGTRASCPPCGDARRAYEAWSARQRERDDAAKHARLEAIATCTRCDPQGQIDLGEAVVNCNHTPGMDRWSA